ncbi:MAG TPA: RNA pseudouridine synthase [Phycisphaerales bacterium]|nr:RNA pseudouridine synthase [Phycisphaerales bacterium]
MPFDEAKLGLKILAQSASDIVVLKPAGMASDLTRDPRRESLISRVRRAAPEDADPKLVNRLDRVTRGPMIVAMSRAAAAFYGEQIREGMWAKFYLARIPSPPRKMLAEGGRLIGKHKAYIKETPEKAKLVHSGGKPSFLEILEVEPASGHANESHVLIRLLTGRLHQIRVMLAGLGLPLIGDTLYGGKEGPMYLEHVALWYVDFTTRDMMLAYLREDPGREPLGASIRQRLAEVTTRPPL